MVFLNPDDMAESGIHAEQWLDITSHFEGESRIGHRFKAVPYDLPRHCAAAYFPEANVLVPVNQTADRSNTPVYKSIRVTLAPHAEAG